MAKEGKKELKEVINYIRQMIHRKLAQFCNNTNGADLYFFYEAFTMLRSDIGDEPLKIVFNQVDDDKIVRWKKLFRALDIIGMNLGVYKAYRDALEQNQIEKGDLDNKMFQQYIKFQKKISIAQRELFVSFIILVKETKLIYDSIPNDAFKKEERGYKPFDYTADRRQIPRPEGEA